MGNSYLVHMHSQQWIPEWKHCAWCIDIIMHLATYKHIKYYTGLGIYVIHILAISIVNNRAEVIEFHYSVQSFL